jgi:hypothetical protein
VGGEPAPVLGRNQAREPTRDRPLGGFGA